MEAVSGVSKRLRFIFPTLGKRILAVFLLEASAVSGAWANGFSEYYVDALNGNDANDGGSWATAKQTIQNAVDNIDNIPGREVWVTNGVYDLGGAVTPGGSLANRVMVNKSIAVRSVNGPEVTFIVGAPGSNGSNDTDAVRGVYLANGAELVGFTVTNGYTSQATELNGSGGGIYGCESSIVSNCIVIGNHAHDTGGGVHLLDSSLFDSQIIGNIAGSRGGGVCVYGSGNLERCLVDGNEAEKGGGLFSYTYSENINASRCTIQNNRAWDGGGVYYLLNMHSFNLKNSIIRSNVANTGGGVYADREDDLGGCQIQGCSIYRNTATYAGGAHSTFLGVTLDHCTVVLNKADFVGGVEGTYMLKSIVYFNDALWAYDNHCNPPRDEHALSTVMNAFTRTCTDPMPVYGEDNIVVSPELADVMHVAEGSPCVGFGETVLDEWPDIDGDAWLDPSAIGCDQPEAISATGPLLAVIRPECVSTQVVAGHAMSFESFSSGHATSNRWAFGDGAVATNVLVASHAWDAPGSYDVVLSLYNTDFPEGVAVTQAVEVVSEENARFHVWTNSPSPSAPYVGWSTAAHTIQEAVDAAAAAAIVGAVVLVTDGVYNAGGRVTPGYALTNRVVVTNNIVLRSVNGPSATIIEGAADGGGLGPAAVRGIYMTLGILDGFTLTNGYTGLSDGDRIADLSGGGGLWGDSAMTTHCVMAGNHSGQHGGGGWGGVHSNGMVFGNSALETGGGISDATVIGGVIHNNEAVRGGGVSYSTLINVRIETNTASGFPGGGGAYTVHNAIFNSLFKGNRASDTGGGVYEDGWLGFELRNCTLVNNEAGDKGGGAYFWRGGKVYNCILWSNTAPINPHLAGTYEASNSCAPNGVTNGVNACITNDPAFGAGYRLTLASPCVDAGDNAWAPTHVSPTDLAGNPRIFNLIVDMGAYENQETTRVTLYDFYLQKATGGVSVCWQTASEEDTVGFDLFRWDGGAWGKVNDALILSQGEMGGSYSVVDPLANATDSFTYKLVEHETDGGVQEYGPFDVSVIKPRLENLAITPEGVVLRWLSREQDTYEVQKTGNLHDGFTPLATGLPATPPVNVYTDGTETVNGAYYRVRVEKRAD